MVVVMLLLHARHYGQPYGVTVQSIWHLASGI
jgi:hypothetical protein